MADYTPRLKASYNEVVRPAMKEEFAYKNDMMKSYWEFYQHS